MKKIGWLLAFNLLVCCAVYCQTKGDIVVSSGVAFNARDVMFPDGALGWTFFIEEPDLYDYSNQAVFNGSFDFSVKSTFSIGVSLASQQLTGSINAESYKFNYKGVRNNFATRILWHTSKLKSLDLYYGMRLGINMYVKRVREEYINGGKDNEITSSGNIIMPAIQGVFGVCYYPIDRLSFNIELGVGPPYAVMAGVVFKVINKKTN